MAAGPGIMSAESEREVMAGPDIGVHISPAVADRLREAAGQDGRLGTGAVIQLAQQAVAAWASAAGGDDRALTALGGPGAASWLTQPVNSKSTRLSPGARVTAIEISGVDADRSPARLDLRSELTTAGSETATRPTRTPSASDAEPDGAGPSSGGRRLTTQRLSSWLGYQFTSRQRRRRNTNSGPVHSTGPVASPDRTFCLTVLRRARRTLRRLGLGPGHPPYPAQPGRGRRLLWPAVEEATEQALGSGDWRPSLNWLEVIELLPDPAR
jgi:hypothetical protein